MATRDSDLSMPHISNGAASLTQINLVNGASPDSGESHADTVIAESGWNRFSACLNERKTMGTNAHKWLKYNPWVMALTNKVCPVVPQNVSASEITERGRYSVKSRNSEAAVNSFKTIGRDSFTVTSVEQAG